MLRSSLCTSVTSWKVRMLPILVSVRKESRLIDGEDPARVVEQVVGGGGGPVDQLREGPDGRQSVDVPAGEAGLLHAQVAGRRPVAQQDPLLLVHSEDAVVDRVQDRLEVLVALPLLPVGDGQAFGLGQRVVDRFLVDVDDQPPHRGVPHQLQDLGPCRDHGAAVSDRLADALLRLGHMAGDGGIVEGHVDPQLLRHVGDAEQGAAGGDHGDLLPGIQEPALVQGVDRVEDEEGGFHHWDVGADLSHRHIGVAAADHTVGRYVLPEGDVLHIGHQAVQLEPGLLHPGLFLRHPVGGEDLIELFLERALEVDQSQAVGHAAPP